MALPSAQPAQEGIRFSDGDVEVVLSALRRYQVHAQTLRRTSRLFGELLEGDGATLSHRALKRGVTVRHRLVLTKEDGVYSFVAEVVDEEGRGQGGQGVGTAVESNHQVDPIVVRLYLVLRAIYNMSLDFDFTNVQVLTEDVMGVLNTAENIGAVASVSKPLESALLTQEQKLFAAISQHPTEWIKLATRLSSRIIFKEALVHIVGRYQELAAKPYIDKDTPRSKGLTKITSLPPDILEMVKQHHQQLVERIETVHKELATFYPDTLIGEHTSDSTREDEKNLRQYEKDIKEWMALAMFRQYYALQLPVKAAMTAPDMGFQLIAKFAKGGIHYLTHTQCAQWHQRFPMSKRAQGLIQNSLDEIKKEISRLVAPLITVNCQLIPTKDHPIRWFTCTNIDVGKFEFVQDGDNIIVRPCEPEDYNVPDWLTGGVRGRPGGQVQSASDLLTPDQPTSTDEQQSVDDTGGVSTARGQRKRRRATEDVGDDEEASSTVKAPSRINKRRPRVIPDEEEVGGGGVRGRYENGGANHAAHPQNQSRSRGGAVAAAGSGGGTACAQAVGIGAAGQVHGRAAEVTAGASTDSSSEVRYSSPESQPDPNPDRAFWYTDRSDVDRREQQMLDRAEAAEGLLAFGEGATYNAPEDNPMESIEYDG
ncbi:Hypothetical protein D9617_29g006710 [Elsinoe fawcettii]|nr:Hypothetical protein D9617_29g006710 [Elsinoe fawcettii]